MASSFTDVESSNLDAVRFHSEESEMDIRFNYKDKVYRYYGVPKSVYRDLMNAESKGRFFHRRIKDNYYNEEVDVE